MYVHPVMCTFTSFQKTRNDAAQETSNTVLGIVCKEWVEYSADSTKIDLIFSPIELTCNQCSYELNKLSSKNLVFQVDICHINKSNRIKILSVHNPV